MHPHLIDLHSVAHRHELLRQAGQYRQLSEARWNRAQSLPTPGHARQVARTIISRRYRLRPVLAG
jgi:hypothetical protein